MDEKVCRYLVAVAKEKHFTRAAKVCNISQPALSAKIKALEERLGILIFERATRNVIVTPVGERIIDSAEKVLLEIEKIKQIADTHKQEGMKLNLGLIPTIAPYLLPRILPGLKAKFSEINLTITESQTLTLCEKLDSGSLDAAILALPVPVAKSFVTRKLYQENFWLAVGGNHPLAQSKSKHVSVQDLRKERVLLLEDGHCLRDQALEVCRWAQSSGNRDFSAASLETLKTLVAEGYGVTLMPQLAMQEKGKAAVCYVPFAKPNSPFRTVGIIWRNTTVANSLKKIADFLQQDQQSWDHASRFPPARRKSVTRK